MALTLTQIKDPTNGQLSELQNIILDMPTFYLQSEGRLPSIEDARFLLKDLPPDASIEMKHFFLLSKAHQTIGCAELIRGWPTSNHCFLSLLALGERFQHKGLGMLAYRKLEQIAMSWPEISQWLLLIAESNASAFPFWQKLGFLPTGNSLTLPHYISKLIYLEKPLYTNPSSAT